MLRRALKAVWKLMSPVTERLMRFRPVRKVVWRYVSQPGERTFHQENEWRRSADFVTQTDLLFRGWGFEPIDMAGKRVLDLGAGSRLRTKFFAGAEIIVIEPLANDYREIDFCDLDEAAEVHAIPAEQDLPHLHGTIDLAVSINVLDHVFDPAAVVANVRRFIEPDGRFLLSVDLHEHEEADLMHPVSMSKEELLQLLTDASFRVEREIEGLPLADVDSYGHGVAYTVVATPAT